MWVKAHLENAKKIIKALDNFDFGALGLSESDFTKADHVIQLGVPPVRIDIITSISGITWEEAIPQKEKGNYGDIPVFYIGFYELLKNKASTGRAKDIADIEALNKKN